MPLHRAGGKITGSHTTVTDATAVVVDVAETLPSVTKIILGPMESTRCKRPRLKFNPIQAGWKITVCGNTSVQTIYVYSQDPQATKMALEGVFS